MSQGLEVYNASGQLRLRVTDRLTRLVYAAEVAATASGSASVPGITTGNAIATSVCVGATGAKAPHEVWITDGTVHWAAMPAPGSSSYDVRQASLILVFRYK